MTVYSFYLFNRSGTCLIYHEWKRPHQVHTADDDQKTMFGMLFALRNFAIKLSSPSPSSTAIGTSSTTDASTILSTSASGTTTINAGGPGTSGLPKYFITDTYALHYFETPTGLRFVLTTSNDFGHVDISNHLAYVYANIYVKYAIHNPLYTLSTPITIPVFTSKLDDYIRGLPCF